MCLILFAHKAHAKYKLIVAANRDEFYARPTLPANYWEEESKILAGKDLEAGGTWLGITTSGRISLLTNYRDLTNIKPNAPSRGHLVSEFLKSGANSTAYLEEISGNGSEYNGFNIICGNIDDLYYYGNYQEGVHQINSGIHGLSNALLETPWPKVVNGKNKLHGVIAEQDIEVDSLFGTLYNDMRAPDHQLPDTGVGYEKEKMLSPMFIKSDNYGSRCSTVILVDEENNVLFAERTYNIHDYSFDTKVYRFKIENFVR
jgi:uncharacterized protein with NRDE domain